ncbi:MAG: winged helix-turn-helix transcriptional regulator [Chloroflexi bacterium]|nr:winged helix-turn-helix transcriptional regulator [Chloroflexota bacterium]
METFVTNLKQLPPEETDALHALYADLRILADEQRLRILHFLTSGERCVCEITQALGISQPLASYHLGLLREGGLVRDRRDGQWIYYSLHVPRLQEIAICCVDLFDPQCTRVVEQDRERCCP